MTNRDFFMATITDETPRFERVIKALPGDKLDFKPAGDDKARTALDLATLMAMETMMLGMLVETGEIDFTQEFTPMKFANTDEIAAAFARGAEQLKTKVANITDDQWENNDAKMIIPGHPWEAKLGVMAWGFLFDLIHHRGQISTYIRPMGGKVPSIYGPSADSAE